jgi:predicted 3-demethylubiquinone-9 3-methyltransferase (glyoxalase superfamily)
MQYTPEAAARVISCTEKKHHSTGIHRMRSSATFPGFTGNNTINAKGATRRHASVFTESGIRKLVSCESAGEARRDGAVRRTGFTPGEKESLTIDSPQVHAVTLQSAVCISVNSAHGKEFPLLHETLPGGDAVMSKRLTDACNTAFVWTAGRYGLRGYPVHHKAILRCRCL